MFWMERKISVEAEKAKEYKEYFQKKREGYLQKILYVKGPVDIEDIKEKARMYNEIVWLLDKQIPVKPICFETDYYCPKCNGYVVEGARCSNINCGQKIDWKK